MLISLTQLKQGAVVYGLKTNDNNDSKIKILIKMLTGGKTKVL